MDISEFLGIFIEEAKEHLKLLGEQILLLEDTPSDQEIIKNIFRSIHTLKGMAATANFRQMQLLSHAIENILSEVRESHLIITTPIIDLLFKAIDTLDKTLETIAKEGSEGADTYQDLLDALNHVVADDRGNDSVHNLPIDNKHGEEVVCKEQTYRVIVKINAHCLFKSARAYVVIGELEGFGDVLYSEPDEKAIEAEAFEDTFSVIMTSTKPAHLIKEAIAKILEVKEVNVQIYKADAKGASLRIVPIQEELVSGKNIEFNKTVRINTERLDFLMNLVSELMIAKTQLNDLKKIVPKGEVNYRESIEYLERITTQLNEIGRASCRERAYGLV